MEPDLPPKIASAPAYPWVDLRNKLPRRKDYNKRSLDEVRYIVWHHSGVDVDSSAESINDYHLNTLGWDGGIGYHYIVHWDSVIEYVGDIETARANVYGRNPEVIGCCIPGDWSNRWPPEAALRAARVLTQYLLYRLPGREVVGHYEIALAASPTTCPGSLWPEWRETLVAK